MDVFARAAALLEAGGLVCFPTDTVYAIAGAADIATTRDRLYAAKRREPRQPMALLESIYSLNRVLHCLRPSLLIGNRAASGRCLSDDI